MVDWVCTFFGGYLFVVGVDAVGLPLTAAAAHNVLLAAVAFGLLLDAEAAAEGLACALAEAEGDLRLAAGAATIKGSLEPGSVSCAVAEAEDDLRLAAGAATLKGTSGAGSVSLTEAAAVLAAAAACTVAAALGPVVPAWAPAAISAAVAVKLPAQFSV